MKSSQKENTFIFDLLAGLTVSFAALSLGAAFGTMSGRGAFAGMVGAAIIPIITSAFGGTRLQASGPTAPMTAVSALVVAFAYENFPDKVYAEQFITLIFILNALMLILLGIFKIGRFIQYVPQVIILGFMNGIGLLIWYDQIKRLFGWGDKTQIAGSLTTNILIGLATLAAIYLLPFVLKKLEFLIEFGNLSPLCL
ncbi:MAG: SulP family inorganic anion transporter [Saprospiraceae bacterium]|nr:SulP family inorganic anion transporter [Saprospiraceae bacterium]